jgi:MHS family proline/betaine transporter-like MFS transporter
MHLESGHFKQKIGPSTLKIFFPAIFGTIVEYYDYALYGFCASLLAAQFFPTEDPNLALLKTFGIFLTGSLSKPFGAIIFGHIGDRIGRQISLKISMIGIIIPTTLIGCLPTYENIGWIAPFLLLVCRIFQGIFTSGESDGVRIFIYETIGQHRPCLANSISGIACMLGIYLASFAFSIIMRFEAYPNAWRLPFLIGGLLGMFVFFSRCYLTETPAFVQYLKSSKNIPTNNFFTTILKNKKPIFSTILLCGSVGGVYHFYMVFFGHYLSNTLALVTPKTTSLYTAKALLIYTLCGPIAGILADRFGPIQILKISLIGLFIAAIVNTAMINQGTMNIWVFLATTVLVSFFSIPGFIILLQQFSVSERYRCLSFGHAIGSMIFSGSTPIISLYFWSVTKIPTAPIIYFYFLISIGFLAIFLLEYDRKYQPNGHILSTK